MNIFMALCERTFKTVIQVVFVVLRSNVLLMRYLFQFEFFALSANYVTLHPSNAASTPASLLRDRITRWNLQYIITW